MTEGKQIEVDKSKMPVKISNILQTVKENSWVGHLGDDTKDLDFIMNELKAMLNEELEAKDRVRVLKQLQDLDNEKAKRAMHLDLMIMKSMEINAFKPKDVEGEDLWN